jgi:hypothetical protein
MDRSLHEIARKYMIKSDVKTTSSVYVKNGYTQHANTIICFVLCANKLENSCNVYHIFLQYGYDQCTLIRNAHNLITL